MNEITKNSQMSALLTLNALAMGTTAKWHALLADGMTAVEMIERIEKENLLGKRDALIKTMSRFHAERELDQCQKQGIECVSFYNPGYPELLKNITDPPLVLYVKGAVIEKDQLSLAVVGSRHASFYGVSQTRRFCGILAGHGVTVVSGLARGIDQNAHEAALSITNGRTIAVVGSGLDVVYPRENKNLFDRITDRGAVISEYPLGTAPLAKNFPKRNRIISGLGLGVLVVEAHERSGSLITAREALDQGREVFAIPGQVDQLTSRGTNRLIKEGAHMAQDPEDILETLAAVIPNFIKRPKKDKSALPVNRADKNPVHGDVDSSAEDEVEIRSECGKEVVTALSDQPLTYHEICTRFGTSPGETARLLIHLEMEKKVIKNADGRYHCR